ncbi:MAG: ATP-binding cassette domain-containing protein [Treponema sp.]|jgi:peptide/nickel transport system ATP-binding protein|nr:ATP-binding cassette domain-containing protein [Treponema sp.]
MNEATTNAGQAAGAGMPEDAILRITGLKKYFPINAGILKRTAGYVKAVDDVDIIINRGETFGLVGESGCGKTTIGRCVLRAINATGGSITYRLNNRVIDINKLGANELRLARRNMQLIFQDPYSSLNPRMTVLGIISEPMICNKLYGGAEIREKTIELMELVGLDKKQLERYPHAFSGGQRQRIGIARALATSPDFIVCDEAVSALDVSVQAQILNLLMDLQRKLHLSYLFISHDLGVIRHISDRIGVMYVGKLVETGVTNDIFAQPLHPYTEALLSAIPKPNPRLKGDRIVLEGEVANPAKLPEGCYFHPRCRYAEARCKKEQPQFRDFGGGRLVACHRAGELTLRSGAEQ